MKLSARLLVTMVCLTAVTCGGGGTPMPAPTPPPVASTPPTAPLPPAPTPEPAPAPPPPPGRATITITANGFEPKEVVIAAGGRVTFVNNDARPHVVMSDPEFLHTGCPPINEVNYLNSGQRKDTGLLDATPACGFHDHFNEFNAAFKGVIVVRAPATAVAR